MLSRDSVCVVVPVYNGADTLEELTARLTQVLSGFRDYRIVLVDDCSTDGSFALITRLCRWDGHLTGLRLAENSGQQSAVFCGLRESRADYTVIIDDDLEQDPADIPLLYAEIQQGFDAVYGVPPAGGRGAFRTLGSTLRDLTVNFLTRKPRRLKVSSFRILSRYTVDCILRANTRFVYISLEMLRHTVNIGNVEIARRAAAPSGYRPAALMRLLGRMVVYYAPGFFWRPLRRRGPCFRVAERVEGGLALASDDAGRRNLPA